MIPKLNTAQRIIACWKRSLHRYLEKPPTSVPRCARYLAIELLDFPATDGYASDVTELASSSVNIANANCGRQQFAWPPESQIRASFKQQVSDAYVHGVKEQHDVLLDSSPPIAAMLAADEIGGRGVVMLQKLQYAYYQ